MRKVLEFCKNHIDIFIFLFLVLFTIPLRFINLGYSDYVKDEHVALLRKEENQPWKEYLMEQRKGPMQIVVSILPYPITQNLNNELGHRIPFAVVNILAVYVFYALVKKLTKSTLIGFIAAILFSLNGFIVGFGRIVQYQSLNMLFSFISLYYYSELLSSKKNIILKTLLGTFFFALSLLSHWDVVFYLVPTVYFFIRFLKNKEFSLKYKLKLLALNFAFGCILLLPYLVPYVHSQLNNADNQRYFFRRVGLMDKQDLTFKELIDLYNPFVVYWFYVIAGALGLVFIKRNALYISWFLVNFGVFFFFVKKPGTHIYNFLIPLFIVIAVLFGQLIQLAPKYLKIIPISLFVVLVSFFYYQDYMIFVDHSKEYPWQRKEILNWETPKYDGTKKLPMFGFTKHRYWNEINDLINELNSKNHENLRFATNEDSTYVTHYLDAKHGVPGKGDYYYIGIKRPWNFVNDWNGTNHSGKELVGSFNTDNEDVVRIWRVRRLENKNE